MKVILGFILTLLLTTPAFAGFRAYDGATDLKTFDSLQCGGGITCSKAVNKLLIGSGQQRQVAATATTILATQCGSTFYNTAAVVINLPSVASAPGCRLTFITANASNFDINPQNSDLIRTLTDVAGDAIRNATIGNTVVIQAFAGGWAPISTSGTWTDVN